MKEYRQVDDVGGLQMSNTDTSGSDDSMRMIEAHSDR